MYFWSDFRLSRALPLSYPRHVCRPDFQFAGCRLAVANQILFLQLILLAIGGKFLTSPAFAQSGASYTAERRIDTIVIDGNLNEASWQNAADTSVFTFWDGSPAPVSIQTTAKMIWDDQYLYIAFTARDPDVYATYTARDSRLWEQDNFEVFVTVPGTTGYVEAEGSPRGTIWDGVFTNVFQGPGGTYNMAGLQVSARVNGTLNNSSDQDTGFTAEMRLPFADIYQGNPVGHPLHGTQLRLNLNRINWNTPATQGGVGAAGSDTYYAWSPVPGTGISFHRPDKFGTVTFSTNSVPAPVWMFTAATLAGSNLVLSGFGHPGGNYRVLVTPSLAWPITNWTRLATNSFDSVTGEFTFTNSITPANPQLFYRLQSL
jgi:hypothetical protein